MRPILLDERLRFGSAGSLTFSINEVSNAVHPTEVFQLVINKTLLQLSVLEIPSPHTGSFFFFFSFLLLHNSHNITIPTPGIFSFCVNNIVTLKKFIGICPHTKIRNVYLPYPHVIYSKLLLAFLGDHNVHNIFEREIKTPVYQAYLISKLVSKRVRVPFTQ